jgi:hypothetical protein
MNDIDFIWKLGAFIISLIPLLLRFFINFKQEETCISNNKKYLLDQIRANLSTDHANSIVFNEDIVTIDKDFYSKLQDKFHELLSSQTIKFYDFFKALRIGNLAIKWIRCLKYLLVISSSISILLFTLILLINGKNINILKWYIYFVGIASIIIITWIIKERLVDSFGNLCIKYEIERKD